MGTPVLRVEDAPLVTGSARWVDNIMPAGVTFLAVVRSPVAHGRIVDIDLAAARARDDVIAACTGAELRDRWVAPPPIIEPKNGFRSVQWPLAVDTVRYVGEPLAVLVTTSRAAAEDALESVFADIEPLAAVPTIDAGLDAETLVHPDAPGNLAFRVDGPEVGDVEAAFASADVVVQRTFVHQRVMAVAMEPRATLAIPHDDGTMTVHTSTQVPHRVRASLARVLGIDEATIRVRAEHVGGAFGPKLEVYAEDYLCTLLARELGMPVRFTATRSDDLLTTIHGRGQTQRVTAAASADGRLLALRVESFGDVGAYLSRSGSVQAVNAARLSPGAYRWDAFSYTVRGVFTNRTPIGPYRGAGRPEATFAVERIVDELAVELGLDPAELRRRNMPGPDEFPFASASEFTYDSGDYVRALDTALDLARVDARRAEQRRRLDAGESRLLGVGLACYVDRCGGAPGVTETGGVRLADDGRIVLTTGLGPSGQGTVTSLMQIAADVLGVPIAAIDVRWGDTDEVPTGSGTFGSRSMATGGTAIHRAALLLAEQICQAAAERLEVAVEDLELRDGSVVVRGAPGVSVTLAQLAARADTPLAAEVEHAPDGLTFPSGSYVAVVEVDTDTGHVSVVDLVAVDDAGTIINPALFVGQVQGGTAQGIGQALFEDAACDADANPLAATLADYSIPAAADLPRFTLAQQQTASDNPLGVKGVGESGAIAAPAAVVNAILDALRPLGVRDVPLPCTPPRVWAAIQAVRS